MAVPSLSPGNPSANYPALAQWKVAIDTVVALVASIQDSLAAQQAGLVAEISARSNAVANEALIRGFNDSALQQAFLNLQGALSKATTDLQTVLGNENRDRLAAETAEVAARQAGDAQQAARTDDLGVLVDARRYEYVPAPGRPGDAPGRYTVVSSVAALSGPRNALPPVPASALANSESGQVVRVTGPSIVASRAAFALEPGRLARARFAVQRRVNVADPSGDAIVCGLAYLDQSYRLIGGVSALRAYPALTTALGRQECEALISRTQGMGAAFVAPPTARFAVPLVAFYGPDHRTDVEVLAIEDVTAAFVLAPPPDGLEARISDLVSALASRIEVLESEAGTPSKLTFGAKGDAAYAPIPAGVQVVELLGRQYAGDGGGGRYVRTTATLAADADSFTSNGAVFVREVVSPDVVAGMLDSGFDAWIASLPTEPPDGSGKRWNNNGIPVLTP